MLHLVLERARLSPRVPVSVEVGCLPVQVRLNLMDHLQLFLRFLFVHGLLIHPFLLLLAETLNLFAHFSLLRGSVMPVIGLQLRDLVHGHLALVTLLLNVLHELILAHSIELVLDLVG